MWGLLGALLLSGCAQLFEVQDGPPTHWVDIATIPEPQPQPVTRSATGNPPNYAVNGQRYTLLGSSQGYKATGLASWYGRKFHGRPTASGEIFDMYGITAAHRTLPIPVYARITNLNNQRSLIVRINDRGPFHSDRILDLSYAAAAKLDIIRSGTAPVRIETIDTPLLAPTGRSAAQTIAQHEALYLQVGAFSERTNAERVESQLQAKLQAPIRIISEADGERSLHRVHIGPIASVEEADALRHRLTNLGFTSAHIITP